MFVYIARFETVKAFSNARKVVEYVQSFNPEYEVNGKKLLDWTTEELIALLNKDWFFIVLHDCQSYTSDVTEIEKIEVR